MFSVLSFNSSLDPVEQNALDSLLEQKQLLVEEMPVWKAVVLFLTAIGAIFYFINLVKKIEINKQIAGFSKPAGELIEMKSFSYRNALDSQENPLEELEQSDDILETSMFVATLAPRIEIILSLVNYEGTIQEVISSISERRYELDMLNREYRKIKDNESEMIQKLCEEKWDFAHQHLLNQLLIYNQKV